MARRAPCVRFSAPHEASTTFVCMTSADFMRQAYTSSTQSFQDAQRRMLIHFSIWILSYLTLRSRKFPGVCLFSEIYQGTAQRPTPYRSLHLTTSPVTGPVARFARQIAGHGYIVAAPSSYHDFTGPEPLKYDVADTDRGNKYKFEKVYNRLSPQPTPQKPQTPNKIKVHINVYNRLSSLTMPIHTAPSTTSSPYPPVPASSAQQACVSAATSPSAPRYYPSLSNNQTTF